MSESKANPPAMLWAQSGNEVYVTVSMECSDPEYKFTEDSFWFKGSAASTKHEVCIDLFGKVKADSVKCKNIGRCIEFSVLKEDETAEYWPRLNKENKKLPFLRVDFKKWKDEDDPYSGDNGGDAGGMGGMGNAFDGMNFGQDMFGDKNVNLPDFYDDEEDSDDELDEPPPAEDVKKEDGKAAEETTPVAAVPAEEAAAKK